MFSTVLIANRSEIAVRTIRTLKQMGIRSVAVYAHPDRHSQHVELADQAVELTGDNTAETYLDEAMKMEFEINASATGTISALHCESGKSVAPGEPLVSIAT